MADPTLPGQQMPMAGPPPGGAPGMPPGAAPGPRAPRPWMVGLVGAVVGALVAGVPLLLAGGGDGGGGLGASHDALSAPSAVGAYSLMIKNPKVDANTIKRVTSTETVSTKNLSDAYGGATALFRQYTDSTLENDFSLAVVRAQSPKPFFAYVDPAQLGMAKPEQDVEMFGQVACVVHYQPVAAGQQEQPDQIHVSSCERTSAHLTVRLLFGGGDAWKSPADAAALTDKAWSQFS
ncbi:MAG: hypothetical protein HOW97_30035 [Catenulispora sp.]|nr:hypothetical protein [Catenulispora sp.]